MNKEDIVLRGRNAVITGARTGIGRATVEKLAANGANIWACARQADMDFEADLRSVADRYGVWVRPVYFDLADKSQILTGAKAILDEKLSVDILVNNAAVNQVELFMQTSIDKIEQLFAIDLFAPLLLTQKLAKRMMRQRSGSIINISSERGIRTAPGRLAYSAAKAAMLVASETLALELAVSGIRVNSVAPGQIETSMLNDLTSESAKIKNILGRFGTADEVANAILFLASDMSSYITGETIQVTGGTGVDFSSAKEK